MTRTCVVCTKAYVSNLPNKQTCSPGCSDKLRADRTANWRRARKGQPPKPVIPMDIDRQCSECGKAFSPDSPNQLVCSQKCAGKRHYRRKMERMGYTYKPKPTITEIALMKAAGTAIVAEGMCRSCGEPIRLPVPDNSRICSWCWVDGYMPAEDRQRLKETSKW